MRYFALGERVVFDDVPKALDVEVRTRVVDAAPKMPRNRWDLPLGAIAITAACMNAMVVGSLAHREAPSYGEHIDILYSSAEQRLVASDETATALSPIGLRGVAVDGEMMPVSDDNDDDAGGQPEVAFGDTGMLGLLARYQGDGHISAPWAPAAHDSGVMWGDRVGEAWGVAGIGLSGIGQGGGGNGLGNYVLDRVHTDPLGAGRGHGTLRGHHTVGIVCTLRFVEPISCIRIAPEIIQRIVHASEGRFRGCYQDGLRRDPKLAGRVVTKFVIGRDGTVAAASDGGSDLGDAEVVSCVTRAFMSLEFPANPDGIATVTYPIVMSPE